ncbi:DUF294 nucleotidyltransferase-like domain-containing protein [Desulfovirgula thermocuniculi]|uniref:DUF294 nucleotidyltransferase-like domain-containing protein n=1 Tax=Desulfovirgula thermocuniculi TaxID=348842 RepID=UPI0003F7F062|nr:DUF294 nucleotidyltransferase-like domain-containing protein [Desulfovirgula thermocuniculi]
MEVDVLEVLRSCPPFSVLGEEVLAGLARHLEVRLYPRGAYAFRQGQKSLGVLFLVASGTAEVTVTDEHHHRETVVGYRRRGDFFGETALFTGKTYGGSVRAAENMACLLIPQRRVEELIAGYPEFASFFTALLSERLRLLYAEAVARQPYEAYGAAESTPFHKRVSEIMTWSPVTCRLDTPVSEVARRMADHQISSVIVLDEGGYPAGLVTEKDLVHKVLAYPSCGPAGLTAEQVMDRKLVKLQVGDYYGKALLAVVKHQVKHMVVLDGERLAGVLTLRDLIKARSTGSLWVTDKIERARTLDDLARIGREVDSFLSALVAEKARVPELFEIITEMHDRLTCRVIELCEKELAEEGFGTPPVAYCWISMGSAGRKEQTLRTDQDNAIIYAGGGHGAASYFQVLGARVVEELVRAGFAWCKGGVMASNPRWCRSLDNWKEVVSGWMERAEPEDIRLLTILLDFRPVYGAADLAEELREHIFGAFSSSGRAPHFLAEEEVQARVPLTFLGGFATEKGGPHKNELNLKEAARHIVNCARIFAVKYGLRETSTLGRLRLLVEKGVLPEEDGEYVQGAFETLMMLRIRENLRKVRQGREADNYLNPYRLSRTEQMLLKDALLAITRLQKLTSRYFTDHWLRYVSS